MMVPSSATLALTFDCRFQAQRAGGVAETMVELKSSAHAAGAVKSRIWIMVMSLKKSVTRVAFEGLMGTELAWCVECMSRRALFGAT